MNKMLKSRIINSLYALAVSDAVGNPFEFKKKINTNKVLTYAKNVKTLIVSDDTQMTLFGLEAILGKSDITETLIKEYFTKAYLDWFKTQTTDFTPTKDHSLLNFSKLYSIQAPGMTCWHSLELIECGSIVENDSSGCGSVMRLLPFVWLMDKVPFEECVEYAKISGSITHKHKETNDAIELYMNICKDILSSTEFSIKNASKISEIGLGWTAKECVEMAAWAFVKAKSFDNLLELSIAHDGDSDSVAAVAGSLWGLSGKDVPKEYIGKLDVLDAIEWMIENIKNEPKRTGTI